MTERIDVTKTFLPLIEDYEQYLKQIWDSDQLTNQGPLVKRLQAELEAYLKVDNLQMVSNGTIALQIALQALGITEGEVITTPFSYVATTSAILWQRCQPVFVDIDPDTLCIDADKIEAAITPRTKAIMPVHVFGNPCDIEKIDAIAKRHGLGVIYDAAHAFGVRYKGESLLEYGDISICSFHATKLFHTIEGGCLIAKDKTISDKTELIKRFGHNGDEHFMLGINAKASEFQAAMGLCNLKYMDQLIAGRKKVFESYNGLLGNTFRKPIVALNTEYNYAYYPVVLQSENKLLESIEALNKENIFPRRYFYPSLNTLPYLRTTRECPVSEDIAKRILCLPLYPGLDPNVIKKISEVING